MNESDNFAIQQVKVRLSALEGNDMEQWLHDLTNKIEGLTEQQRSQLKKALNEELLRNNSQTQVLGGNQISNQIIGTQQFIFQEESLSKLSHTLAALAVTINEQFGAELGAEIIKTAIMAFAGTLGK